MAQQTGLTFDWRAPGLNGLVTVSILVDDQKGGKARADFGFVVGTGGDPLVRQNRPPTATLQATGT